MSTILKMLEAADKGNSIDFQHCSREAIPSIRRLVQWVESAEHKKNCTTLIYSNLEGPVSCSCGLMELQSLLRS